MSKDLYVNSTFVYRIFDPIEDKFCCSGRGLNANNGRSIWTSRGAAARALVCMPDGIKDRLIIKQYALVETEIER